MNLKVMISKIILILLTVVFIFHCSRNPNVAGPQEDDLYTIRLFSGGNQSGFNGEVLRQPIVVQLMRPDSLPVVDAEVSFSVKKGWGTINKEHDTTDVSGMVTVQWTMGPGPENRLLASYVSKQTNIAYTVDVYAQTTLEFETSWTSGLTFIDNFGVKILHDNRILETQNVLVFSDASSDSVKIEYAYFAEKAFAELKQLFDISSIDDFNNLGFIEMGSKITIYTNRFLDHKQYAFPYGFILYALDSPIRLAHSESKRKRFRLVVRHEMMHVVQWLFGLKYEGSINLEHWPDSWFSEGIAVWVAEGGSFDLITHINEVNEWRQKDTHINPIAIHARLNLPANAKYGDYYPMFGLAVQYLLDENGLGNTYNDIKAMYKDMLISNSFSASFEKYMGISLKEYENNFYTLIPGILK